MSMTNTTRPGINQQVQLTVFPENERNIIAGLSKEWNVTNVGEIQLGATSLYRYVLLKPTEKYSEMFNLEREIVAVFSPYESFHVHILIVHHSQMLDRRIRHRPRDLDRFALTEKEAGEAEDKEFVHIFRRPFNSRPG